MNAKKGTEKEDFAELRVTCFKWNKEYLQNYYS